MVKRDNCTSVQELKVIGGDHDWPGSSGNMDINATNEIWNFVSRYDINGLIDCNTTGSYEININDDSNLIKVTDLIGRDAKKLRNAPLFYHYDNGKVIKNHTLLKKSNLF